jgi:hypothetical protein
MRTYWIKFPRDFGNEYAIGVATSAPSAEQYKAEGYARINRGRALGELSMTGNTVRQVYVGVSVDGNVPDYDRFQLARNIRVGR